MRAYMHTAIYMNNTHPYKHPSTHTVTTYIHNFHTSHTYIPVYMHASQFITLQTYIHT